jgi:hypothetical protein
MQHLHRIARAFAIAMLAATPIPLALHTQPTAVTREVIAEVPKGALPFWIPATQRIISASREKGRWVIREGERTIIEDGEALAPAVTSANQRHLALAVKRPSGTTLLVDGEDRGSIPYDRGKMVFATEPLPVVLSADGRHAVLALRPTGKDKAHLVSVVGVGGGIDASVSADEVTEIAVSSGPSPRLAMVIRTTSGWQLLADGVVVDEMSSGQARMMGLRAAPFWHLVYSPDGRQLAYKTAQSAQPGQRQSGTIVVTPRVVLGGRVHSPAGVGNVIEGGLLGAIAMTDDGQHIAYLVAQRDTFPFIVVRDSSVTKVPAFNRIWGGPVFSGNGAHIAWIAESKEGERSIVIDETTVQPLAFAFDYFGSLRVSDDGRHSACVVTRSGFGGGTRLFVDGREIEKERVFPNSVEFLADGWLAYLAVADGKVARVRMPVP